MEEHLAAWSIAWAELRLSGCEDIASLTEPLGVIPEYPLVEMDFSFLVPANARYTAVVERLGSFKHPLLMHLRYVGSYEGESIGPNQRSLTVRTVVGNHTRTLVEEDANTFRKDFEQHLVQCGYEIRR